MSKQSEQIKKLMTSLDITEEEAIEIVAYDKEEFEIEEVKEMEERAKKLQKTDVKRGRKPKAKSEEESKKTNMVGVATQKRAKKSNEVKANIIEILSKALKDSEITTNIDITNVEKTILFTIGENTFEIDLKQKRKPKA